jgi:hypothetical protein
MSVDGAKYSVNQTESTASNIHVVTDTTGLTKRFMDLFAVWIAHPARTGSRLARRRAPRGRSRARRAPRPDVR